MTEQADTVSAGLQPGERAFIDDMAALALKDGKIPGASRGQLRALSIKASPSDRVRIEGLLERTVPEPKPISRKPRDTAESEAAFKRGAERALRHHNRSV